MLDGRKIFVTNGREASAALVFAQTDRAAGHRGISAFLVEKGTPGFTVVKTEDKLGIRASDTAELLFERLPGARGQPAGRGGAGVQDRARHAGRRAHRHRRAGGRHRGRPPSRRRSAYARERKSFGKPIGEHQMIQWMLADMATEIEAARLLTLRAAWRKDRARPIAPEAAMAKLFAAETAMRVTTDAIQVHGGYGYIKEYQVERLLPRREDHADLRGHREIQKLVIARHLLARVARVA